MADVPDTIPFRDIAIYRDFDAIQDENRITSRLFELLHVLERVYNSPYSDWNFRILISAAFTYYILEKDVFPDQLDVGLFDDLYVFKYVIDKINAYTSSEYISDLINRVSASTDDAEQWWDDYNENMSDFKRDILELVGLDFLSVCDLELYSGVYPQRITDIAQRKRELLGILAALLDHGYPRSIYTINYKKDLRFILSIADLSEINRIIKITNPLSYPFSSEKQSPPSSETKDAIKALFSEYGSLSNILISKCRTLQIGDDIDGQIIAKLFKLSCNILNDDNADCWIKLLIASCLSAPILKEYDTDISESEKLSIIAFFLSYGLNVIVDSGLDEMLRHNWQFEEDAILLIKQIKSQFQRQSNVMYMSLLHEAGIIKLMSIDPDCVDNSYRSNLRKIGSENKQILHTILAILSVDYNQDVASESMADVVSAVKKIVGKKTPDRYIKNSMRWHNFTVLEQQDEKRDARVEFLLRRFKGES